MFQSYDQDYSPLRMQSAVGKYLVAIWHYYKSQSGYEFLHPAIRPIHKWIQILSDLVNHNGSVLWYSVMTMMMMVNHYYFVVGGWSKE